MLPEDAGRAGWDSPWDLCRSEEGRRDWEVAAVRPAKGRASRRRLGVQCDFQSRSPSRRRAGPE